MPNSSSRRYQTTATFIDGSAGKLFVLQRIPDDIQQAGCVILVPPFAEEMNKTRRMFSLLAERLAEKKIRTVVFDLFGTGDSQGDFGDARWEIWKRDIQAVVDYLKRSGVQQFIFLGLRLGCLLALDAWKTHQLPISKLLFWQPVVNGDTFMTQFLRLRLASSMLDGAKEKEKSNELKQTLKNGKPLEVAGYELNAELYATISKLRLVDFLDKNTPPVDWFELNLDDRVELIPASRVVVEKATQNECKPNIVIMRGDSFWTTAEIAVVPRLLDETVQAISFPVS